MRELCPTCYGIGTMQAENWHYTDLNGQKVTGAIRCYNCRGNGVIDWHVAEAQKFTMERNQRMLRAAVDLGGSVYSKESRVFKVQEVREGAISSVYFQPKAVCGLLGMIFPGDLEDTEDAVLNATWDPGNSWRVKSRPIDKDEKNPRLDERERQRYCRAILMQLNQQIRIDDWPQFEPAVMPRDDRTIIYITKLKLDLVHLQKGRIGRSWRDAVAAVQATAADQAA